MLYICTIFHEGVFHGTEDIERTQNTTKEHNLVNNVDRVMNLVFCMSSDDVLYLYQDKNISEGFSVMKQTRFLY